MTPDELGARLERYPRVPLAYLPTPLDPAPRLSQALAGPRIFVKRDDLTGHALGGNKMRKLEFLMADAVRQGADTIVTSAALAALGYVAGGLELYSQLQARDIAPSHLYVATGSGGTHAGLVLASEMCGLGWRIQGISVQRPADEMCLRVADKVSRAADLLSFKTAIKPKDILIDEAYIGRAYGATTQEGVEAMMLAGQTEGLLLDPTYSGKALAGLIGHIRQKRLGVQDAVAFIHTGGAPGVFAHAADIAARL